MLSRGGRGGREAGKSQTEVSLGPALVRVSLVTHTSPWDTETQSGLFWC